MNTLDLLEDVVDEFKERIREELDELDPQEIAQAAEEHTTTHEFCDELGIDVYDIMHEVADNNVPIYYSDLLQLAVEYQDLATSTPELGPAFNGENTACNLIAANVYEWLLEGLQEWGGEGHFQVLVDDYISANEIVLDVGGPSYANYHRVKGGK